MGKGFGIKSEEQLGYVLLLVPEAKAYAAKLDLDVSQPHLRDKNPLIAMVLAFYDLVCFLAKIAIGLGSHKSRTDTLDFDLRSKQEFIGITNLLEEARVWKTIKQAKQAISEYAEFLLEEQKNSPKAQKVGIIRLTRLSNGDLASQTVESLFLYPEQALRE
jgi:hypothetical protein